MGQIFSELSRVFRGQQGQENGGLQEILDILKEMSPEREELQGPKLQRNCNDISNNEDAIIVFEEELENQEDTSQSVAKPTRAGIIGNFRKLFRPFKTFKEKVQRREEELKAQVEYYKIENSNLKHQIKNLMDVNFKLDLELDAEKQTSELYLSQKEELISVKKELKRVSEHYLNQIKTLKAERQVQKINFYLQLQNIRNENCNRKKQIEKMKGAVLETDV